MVPQLPKILHGAEGRHLVRGIRILRSIPLGLHDLLPDGPRKPAPRGEFLQRLMGPSDFLGSAARGIAIAGEMKRGRSDSDDLLRL